MQSGYNCAHPEAFEYRETVFQGILSSPTSQDVLFLFCTAVSNKRKAVGATKETRVRRDKKVCSVCTAFEGT